MIPCSNSNEGVRCRMVFPHETYWSVSEELEGTLAAKFALQEHYGTNVMVELLFCRVLNVQPSLTHAHLNARLAHTAVASHSTFNPLSASGQGRIGLGLSLPDIARALAHHDTRPAASSGARFDPGQAFVDALQAAGRYRRPELGGQGLAPTHSQAASPPGSSDRRSSAVGDSSAIEGNSAASQTRTWQYVGVCGAGACCFPIFATQETVSQPGAGTRLPRFIQSQFGVPDLALISRLCTVFGLHHTQIAFAFDHSGRSVCCEHLFLDISRVPRAQCLLARQEHTPSAQQPGWAAYITFWITEFAQAVAHQGVGPGINEQFLQVQSELIAVMLPTALQMEMGWPLT